MEHEVTEKQELPSPGGSIHEEGWARRPIWEYRRDHIASSWLRIKEWDYYYILFSERQLMLTLTVSDLGYAGLMAAALVDLGNGRAGQKDTLKTLTRGRLGLGDHSFTGSLSFRDKSMSIALVSGRETTDITLDIPDFPGTGGPTRLRADLRITRPHGAESMNIATTWPENRKAFYLNEKALCLPVSGTLTVGGERIDCDPDRDLAGLDWGRGRWTYSNRWFWASLSARIGSVPFGLNLGCGFSDRTPASENGIYYDGRIHKLEEVVCDYERADYLHPWRITDTAGRLELNFRPVVDRSSSFNLLVIKSLQHQVFGYFSGHAVLDDGKTVEIDTLPGFAEDVLNRW